MDYTKQKEVIDDVNKLCYHLWVKWNKKIDYDEINSEAMFWVSGRLKKLIEARANNIESYRSYISISITRRIDRHAREIIVEKANFLNNRFTSHKVKQAILNKENWALEQIGLCCTEKQAKVIYEILKKTPIREIAKELNISSETVNYHFRAGVQNIVVKNYLEHLKIVDPNNE